jgi:NADH-quinone oxidoreductase subunit M
VVIGGFERWGGWLPVLSVAVMISAAYALRVIRRLSTGPQRAPGSPGLGAFNVAVFTDLSRVEVACAGLLAAGVVFVGFFPSPLLGLIAASVAQLARQFGV